MYMCVCVCVYIYAYIYVYMWMCAREWGDGWRAGQQIHEDSYQRNKRKIC